jgi:CDP-diacylglycerol--serine O-phosphatidyltransferase
MAERKRRRIGEGRGGTSTPRSRHLRNGLSILPSLFTVGNIFCAYYSVMSTLNGKWDQAAVAIGVGYILDGLDGRVARLTGTSTEFGAQLDSLADVLTFGIAPAILAFAWGIDWMGARGPVLEGVAINPVEQHLRSAGWLMTFSFVICGALRLARFNVQAQKPVDSASSKRFFVGLPIPAGAGLIASIVHYFKVPINNVGTSMLWCLLIGLTAFLMISTVRYHNFKELGIVSRRPRVALVVAAMMIGLIFRYSEEMLLLLAVVYVSSGPVAKLVQVVRKLPLAATAPREAEPMEARREH